MILLSRCMFSLKMNLILGLSSFLGQAKASDLDTWRQAFIDSAKAEALSPNLIVRNLAILSLGLFECHNAHLKKFSSSLKEMDNPPKNYDPASATRGFSLVISRVLHPSRKSFFDQIAHRNSIKSAKIGHNPSFKYGEDIAKKILHSRLDDGATTQTTYIPKTSPGNWRRTPPYFRPPEQPHWSSVKLFSIPNIREFIPPPPPQPSEKSYFEAVKEVKLLGSLNSPLRTPEQTASAKFWKDFSYSSTPPGHWNEIASTLAREKKLIPLAESRLFALLNLAMADAGIIAWEAKFHYHLWRPIHAIRHADEFRSTRSLSNPNWQSLLESPPHPEYISGHACYSGAASEILRNFFGTDEMLFFVKGDYQNTEFKKYNSFSSCAQEIANSRLWGGIHYRFSNTKGLQTGKRIALYTFKNTLSPKTNL